MDCEKVGKLILKLRKEKKMTQKQLADQMNISDKTISKWERGLGFPDVTLLNELANLLNVDLQKILVGSLEANDADGGNMKKIKFYVCPTCGNIITATGENEITCCGRKLSLLKAQRADESHKAVIEEIEDDFYLTLDHEMTKTHYISFVAYVSYDRILMIRLYPEQSPSVRFPRMRGGKFYFYCSQDGLWVQDEK